MSNDKIMKIVIDEDDVEKLKDLMLNTLSKMSSMADKYVGKVNTNNINRWRGFFDELLMVYVSNLLETHIETMSEFVKMLYKYYEVVEGK